RQTHRRWNRSGHRTRIDARTQHADAWPYSFQREGARARTLAPIAGLLSRPLIHSLSLMISRPGAEPTNARACDSRSSRMFPLGPRSFTIGSGFHGSSNDARTSRISPWGFSARGAPPFASIGLAPPSNQSGDS